MTVTDTGPSYATSGWVEAFLYVLAIACLSLVYAIGHTWNAHPIVFILYAMLVSAVAMLAVVGPGREALAIIVHPLSWLVGASIIVIEVFYYMTLAYLPPANGNMLVRFSIPFAMIAGWQLFNRRPPALAILGACFVLSAVSWVAYMANSNIRHQAMAWGVAAALFMVVRGFASEFHPWNRRARTIGEKIRVTGLVVLVASIVGMAATALAMALVASDVIPSFAIVPTVDDLAHLPTVLLGCLVGSFILTTMAYLNFSSVVKITTENFTTVIALSPAASYLAQEAGAALGLITPLPSEPWLIGAMGLAILGVLAIFWGGWRARRAIS